MIVIRKPHGGIEIRHWPHPPMGIFLYSIHKYSRCLNNPSLGFADQMATFFVETDKTWVVIPPPVLPCCAVPRAFHRFSWCYNYLDMYYMGAILWRFLPWLWKRIWRRTCAVNCGSPLPASTEANKPAETDADLQKAHGNDGKADKWQEIQSWLLADRCYNYYMQIEYCAVAMCL